jgi:hypothetical protein
VWGNFILWGDLARASAQTPGVWNKLKLWLGPPEWTESLAGPLPHRVAQPLENEDIPEPRLRYAAMAFLSGMPVLGALPWVMDESWSVRILLGGIALLTAVTPGVLLEGRSWARRAEGLRLGLAFVAMVGLAMAGVAPVAVGALALALVGSTVGLGAAVLVPVPAVVESA